MYKKKLLVSEIKYVKRTGEMPSPAALSTLSRFTLLLFFFQTRTVNRERKSMWRAIVFSDSSTRQGRGKKQNGKAQEEVNFHSGMFDIPEIRVEIRICRDGNNVLSKFRRQTGSARCINLRIVPRYHPFFTRTTKMYLLGAGSSINIGQHFLD